MVWVAQQIGFVDVLYHLCPCRYCVCTACGVYLVFSSLIIPALATQNVQPQSRALALAYLVGAVAYALGLVVSSISDLPSGAIIVWALIICALSLKFIYRCRWSFAVNR